MTSAPVKTHQDTLDEIDSRLSDASDREAKLAVLRDYHEEDRAQEVLGLIMGDHHGDVIDRAE